MVNSLVSMTGGSELISLGADLRLRRRDLGLNQADLAELSGTSVRFIRNLEHGKATVRLDKVADVLTALGLELRAHVRDSGT